MYCPSSMLFRLASGKVFLPIASVFATCSAPLYATTATAFVSTSLHPKTPRRGRNLDDTFPKKMSTSDEVSAAKEAAAAGDDGAPTIFDKILSGEWSSDKVYEDEICLAFRDVSPQAPVHILVIPKHRDGLTMLSKAREDQKGVLGHLLYVAQNVGKKECPQGFRVVINDGEHGSQAVYHLHLHVLGGRQLGWPPG